MNRSYIVAAAFVISGMMHSPMQARDPSQMPNGQFPPMPNSSRSMPGGNYQMQNGQMQYGDMQGQGQDGCTEECECCRRCCLCGRNQQEGKDLSYNCGCQGSYKFPVPPQYTYHWPGLYSQRLMTDYHSPWRFPPLKPYQEEVKQQDSRPSNGPALQPPAPASSTARYEYRNR